MTWVVVEIFWAKLRFERSGSPRKISARLQAPAVVENLQKNYPLSPTTQAKQAVQERAV
ncbi:hypothetical protein SYN63AY4M2_12765 [Synechococcus sp. 63AY4M2]|nr:hypothetical protein SYN63AY4M2_12765 [Synechococcus sp. 63AY4M2]PIK93241.1 hypothetical protein SYN65AY6LI_10265 [Synechococcus sp. 65AY6Li]PIK96557.1 hypothetical protein SYN60AY4M2_13415 [Synechococcus sp. 60AY4M2]PIK99155.1 hypothetical protein SYN63AY4M1_10720 [Synechococcus sp. 63AY4M1]PIL02396.1 hypothetical protein SYN65AY640_03300 [Synechococcus sp. 65AY640]